MTSTDSLLMNSLAEEATNQPETPPPDSRPGLTPEKELQRGFRFREGIKRLFRMRALKSVSDGMDWEKEAVANQTKLDEEVIRGGVASSEPVAANADGEELDGMQEWVAGDKTITHNHYHPAPPAEKPPPTTAEPATSGWLPTVAVAAATLVGGAGVGYLASELTKPDPPSTEYVDTDTDTQTDVTFPE